MSLSTDRSYISPYEAIWRGNVLEKRKRERNEQKTRPSPYHGHQPTQVT
jgi:hypothetical protein